MLFCPWCENYTLHAETITIGDEQQPIEPYKCSNCGAKQICIYSLADGWRPSVEEKRRGYYSGEHVYRHSQREDCCVPRTRSLEHPLKGRMRARNKGS